MGATGTVELADQLVTYPRAVLSSRTHYAQAVTSVVVALGSAHSAAQVCWVGDRLSTHVAVTAARRWHVHMHTAEADQIGHLPPPGDDVLVLDTFRGGLGAAPAAQARLARLAAGHSPMYVLAQAGQALADSGQLRTLFEQLPRLDVHVRVGAPPAPRS